MKFFISELFTVADIKLGDLLKTLNIIQIGVEI